MNEKRMEDKRRQDTAIHPKSTQHSVLYNNAVQYNTTQDNTI